MKARFTRNRLIGLAIAATVFVLDQLVKYLVRFPLDLRGRPGQTIEVLPFFELRWMENRGVSYGFLEATSPEMRYGLVALTAGIAALVFVWMMRERLLGDIIGLGLILGGAIGNIRDRWDLGYVVDYAHLFFGGFSPFAVFNIADAAITIGVVIILARALLLRDKDRDRTRHAPAENTNA